MDQETPDQERRHKRVRLILSLGVTAIATAAIGFGGLAAWTVTTQNNGSTFATGSVHHSNAATVFGGSAVTCTDATSPGACGAIFTLAGAKPGSSTSGTVKITSTGTLNSTFALGEVSAVNSGTVGNTLCADLTMTVVDNEVSPATVYSGSLSAFTSAAIKANNGNTTWLPADTGTYTFTITLPSATTNILDMASTCTAAFNWTQVNS